METRKLCETLYRKRQSENETLFRTNVTVKQTYNLSLLDGIKKYLRDGKRETKKFRPRTYNALASLNLAKQIHMHVTCKHSITR